MREKIIACSLASCFILSAMLVRKKILAKRMAEELKEVPPADTAPESPPAESK